MTFLCNKWPIEVSHILGYCIKSLSLGFRGVRSWKFLVEKDNRFGLFPFALT